MKLANKCALVTGAGVGIGREVALELARQGADVVLSYHASSAGASSARAEIEALGRRAHTVQADLARVSECLRLVDEAYAFLGRLDILVNNAGVTLERSFLDVTPAEYDQLYAINMRGQFFCAQRAAQSMVAAGDGIIINMLSIHGLVGYPGYTVYDGTKGAIQSWTRSLATELAPQHVRVVGVAPGAIEVPRYKDLPGYTPESMGKLLPWRRVGKPIDIAKTCAFLASADADFIVGSTIVVDGGTASLMALDLDDL